MKVSIKYVRACYVESWNDGEPCPNDCSEHTYPNKQTAIKNLRAEGYDDDEIDIDPYDHEVGWWIEEITDTFDTADGYDITVE